VQGLLTNVLNPKAALFYLTFLPQFINPDDNVFVKALFLAGIHVTLGLIWLTTYAYAIERLAALMQGARRGLERVSGVDLVALGVRLALDR
jgi:threonine/homoserine/homoserine lactone efflux protein